MKVTIEIKNVYGINKNYPICDTAKLFAQLTGSKTLSQAQLRTIEALGYTIEVIRPLWRSN